MIRQDYDPDTGIVTSTSSGLLTVEEIERSGREIRILLAKARAKFGRAWHLVDAREVAVQPRKVMEAVERDGSLLSHPNDKQAIVVPTSLNTIQSRRVYNAGNERTFRSIEEALAWFQAE